MAEKKLPEIDAAAGPQQFIDIRRVRQPTDSYEIEVRDPLGQPLYNLSSEHVKDKTSIVVMVAQAMAGDAAFGFGRDQLPYRWTGNRWVVVDKWLSSLDYSMHALIRTPADKRMTQGSLTFEAFSAWRARSVYPIEGLELGAFGNCPGIPFRDKVLKLADGSWTTAAHDPANFNTRVLDLDAEEAGGRYLEVSMGDAEDSVLMKFLSSTLDEDQVVLFRRWLGYHLVSTRLPNAEKMLYLWGSGGNGKSQLLWLIRKLVGSDACADLRLGDLRTSANIEKLVGKLAMVGSEATSSTDLETLKALISHEPLNCNPKYRDPFTVVPECLVSQASNEPPHFDERSDAMARRTIALHLKNSFIDEKLRKEDIAQTIIDTEFPLLVGLALWGAEELSSQGRFVVPASISAQSTASVASGNRFNDFADMLEFGPYEVATSELYDCYVRWCRDEGLSRAAPRKELVADVLAAAVKRKRTVQELKKAINYVPQHWRDETGSKVLVHPKLGSMHRIDVLCGVRLSADVFGDPIGQDIPGSRQQAHLFQ